MKKIIIVSFPDQFIQKLTSLVQKHFGRIEISKMYTYFQLFNSFKKGNTDVIFLDSFSKASEMIEAGKKIRSLDPKVIIIGMTNSQDLSLKEQFLTEVSNSEFIVKNEDDVTTIINRIQSKSTEPEAKDSYIKQTSKTVLVVDDFENTLHVIKHTLEQSGFKVLSANNGLEALKLLKQNIKPNIIVTDLNMPNMNGFELIENIRKMPNLDGIPIFILTTEFNFSKKLQARKLNITGWIQKPYKSDDFIRIISNVLE